MWRLTDEQRALREEIRAIVREEIRRAVREIDEDCEYPRDLYAVMAEHDLLGLGFPREYGGALRLRRRRGAPTSRSSRRSRARSR